MYDAILFWLPSLRRPFKQSVSLGSIFLSLTTLQSHPGPWVGFIFCYFYNHALINLEFLSAAHISPWTSRRASDKGWEDFWELWREQGRGTQRLSKAMCPLETRASPCQPRGTGKKTDLDQAAMPLPTEQTFSIGKKGMLYPILRSLGPGAVSCTFPSPLLATEWVHRFADGHFSSC